MEEIERTLRKYGQGHLLESDLTEGEKKAFFELAERVDWSVIARLGERGEAPRGEITPIGGLGIEEIEGHREEFMARGIAAIRAGEVAAVLLAGGQGTRLGSDAPKGCYDLGITHPLYIFEQLIRNLTEVTDLAGAYVPLLIMTSEKNDAATRAFLKEHAYFGYPEAYVRFFIQDMAPCVDFSGKAIWEARGVPALSPNGNGGWYSSMVRAHADEDFPDVKWYNVFAVDNVLQRIADPAFLGATISSGMMCGSKVVSKAYPEERVGVLCLEDGLPSVIEYYELTPEMANRRDGDGKLVFRQGVTLNYLFRADRLREIAEREIPVHIAKKKIPCLKDGVLVKPDTENGYKFETLILDMVHLMGSCLSFEVVREHEFAPIKNRTGVDSVESARELLKKNGVTL